MAPSQVLFGLTTGARRMPAQQLADREGPDVRQRRGQPEHQQHARVHQGSRRGSAPGARAAAAGRRTRTQPAQTCGRRRGRARVSSGWSVPTTSSSGSTAKNPPATPASAGGSPARRRAAPSGRAAAARPVELYSRSPCQTIRPTSSSIGGVAAQHGQRVDRGDGRPDGPALEHDPLAKLGEVAPLDQQDQHQPDQQHGPEREAVRQNRGSASGLAITASPLPLGEGWGEGPGEGSLSHLA